MLELEITCTAFHHEFDEIQEVVSGDAPTPDKKYESIRFANSLRRIEKEGNAEPSERNEDEARRTKHDANNTENLKRF